MNSAILGGSFNPIHEGHISLASAVHDRGFSRILFIPAADPPHKNLVAGASDSQRLEMLHIALADLDWADIWDGEISRGGKSYSIDTIRELKRASVVGDKPGLIIGDDLAEGFHHWREVDELVDEVQLILARRTGIGPVDFPYPCVRLENDIWPYSSTKVRNLIAEGASLDGVVPPAVAAYIEEKGLYGIPR